MRSIIKFLPWQLAYTSIYHVPGWPLAPEDLTQLSSAGLMLVWVLVEVYIVSALVSRAYRTPCDWISGAYVVGT